MTGWETSERVLESGGFESRQRVLVVEPMSSLEIDEAVRSSVGDRRSLYTVDAELIDSLAPNVILTQDLCAVRLDHVNHDG